MTSIRAEVAFPYHATLGEGSLWDHERQWLYWVDIYENKVFIYDPKKRANLAYDVGANVGTVVPTRDGRLLVALRDELATLDLGTGLVDPVLVPAPARDGIRFNDGKCDPEGRFWVGTMVEQGLAGTGVLYCVSPDMSSSVRLDGLTISNGLVWHDAHFYHIDTPSHMVRRFSYDARTGVLGAPSVAARFEEADGAPDGMCLDDEGLLWVALWGGHSVVRVDPSNGAIVYRVEVPASNVTSCAFGGKELDELYITTARAGLDPKVLAREPLAGSLFRVKLPFRGVPAVPFARGFA